ncbi:aldo/keto reductase [Oricola sp.]|uniref:aldo/keto reductase n=1 Tax=Oricola sp. TaxID=1979950 RepID=UPI0025D9AEBE|nr:aldo/keto reductase [Oricola sp.]MCI5078644.1 aldo/keto reductase [Oricola sp.]
MEMKRLGATGPMVSRFGFGTMSLLTSQSPADAAKLVHKALDAGINLIDTADIYDNGAVEKALGEVLAGRRDKVVLATKVGLPMHGDLNQSGGSRRWIMQAVDDSLRRLKTDYIDLYQLHRPDPRTPVEETVAAFDALIRAGKIRHAGSSVFPPELLVQSQWAAEKLGATAFASEQSPYSILVRGIERSVLPVCQQYGMGLLAWSPLNGGWLTGKYRRGAPAPEGSRAASGNPFVRADDAAKLDATEALTAIAETAGLSLMQMSLAWTLEHPGVTATLLGPRTAEQLDQLLSADGITLDTETLDAIDAVVAPGEYVDPRNAGWAWPGLAKDQRRSQRG